MGLRFFAEDGLELPPVTTEQMIEVDSDVVEDTGLNLFQMDDDAASITQNRGWPGETGELWLADIGSPPSVYCQVTLGLKYTLPFGERYRIRIMVRSSCA